MSRSNRVLFFPSIYKNLQGLPVMNNQYIGCSGILVLIVRWRSVCVWGGGGVGWGEGGVVINYNTPLLI